MAKTYTIEVVSWEGQTTATSTRKYGRERYQHHYTPHKIKTFKTQKAAREYLTNNQFTPIFKSAKRPTLYTSANHGMQAQILEVGNPYFIGTEGTWMNIVRG